MTKKKLSNKKKSIIVKKDRLNINIALSKPAGYVSPRETSCSGIKH